MADGRRTFRARPARSRVKWEARRGLYEGDWLKTFHCNPPGLYGYLQLRREYGSDCVKIITTFVAMDFGVERGTIRGWLDSMEELGLAWSHRVQNGVCVHLGKAGDHDGNEWIPAPRTHLDRRSDAGKTPLPTISDAGETPLPNGSEAGNLQHSDAGETPLPGPPLNLRTVDSKPKDEPRAAASRTPDGARGGAESAPDLEAQLAEAVAAGDETTARFLRSMIGYRQAKADGASEERARRLGAIAGGYAPATALKAAP